MLATNEKDVDFKSVMCIFICTFHLAIVFLIGSFCVRGKIFNQITFCIPKSYIVMVLNFLFSTKGFI